MFTKAQYNKVYADITANMLVDMGFENVIWSEEREGESMSWRIPFGVCRVWTGPCHRPHPENRLAGERANPAVSSYWIIIYRRSH